MDKPKHLVTLKYYTYRAHPSKKVKLLPNVNRFRNHLVTISELDQ